jgi:hypothetical protein
MYVKRLQCNEKVDDTKGLADTCCYNRRTWSVMVVHEAVEAYCDGYDVGYELYWYDDWLGTEVMFEHA